MQKLKTLLRYTLLVIIILLALIGIPLGTFLPNRREMDEDPEIKTEIVERSEQKD